MNIVVATSRGKGLHPLESLRNTIVYYRGGAEIVTLADKAVDILADIHTTSMAGPNFVYFVAGLPDVTTRTKRSFRLADRVHKYEEVTFREKPHIACTRVMREYRKAEKTIIDNGAIPVFCTITPSSLYTWNHTRLSQGKTSHLEAYKEYDVMQKALIETISRINREICSINIRNNVATPKLDRAVIVRRPRGNANTHIRYDKLPDGVHLNKKLVKSWLGTLERVLKRNQDKYEEPTSAQAQSCQVFSEDSDSETDTKRDWMY